MHILLSPNVAFSCTDDTTSEPELGWFHCFPDICATFRSKVYTCADVFSIATDAVQKPSNIPSTDW